MEKVESSASGWWFGAEAQACAAGCWAQDLQNPVPPDSTSHPKAHLWVWLSAEREDQLSSCFPRISLAHESSCLSHVDLGGSPSTLLSLGGAVSADSPGCSPALDPAAPSVQ